MGFDKTISSEQRQGKYGSSRYHGKYNFGSTGYDPNTMTLTTAKLYLTATASGKSASRALWLRAGSSKDSSIIAKSNGSKYSVSRQATNEINLLNANSNAVAALKNGYFGMYVSQSNDDYYFTDSAGVKYSTHYIKFSKARLLLEWVYKNGTLKLSSDSVNVGSSGSSLTVTVDNYQTNYYYRLIISVGSVTQSYNIGTKSSYSVNFADSTWQAAVTNGLFANATSIVGTITLQTFSDSNYTTQMGSDSSTVVTFVGTGLTAPTLTTGLISYINSKYNQITNFAVSGDGSVIVEYTATGQQGASIASQSVSSVDGFTSRVETSKITLTPNSTVKSGTYTFTLNVIDSRGLPGSINFSIIAKKYNGPTPIIKSVGRKAVAGVEQISIQYSSSFFEGSSFDEGYIIIINSNNDIVVNQNAGKISAASGTFTTNISGGVSEVEHTVFLYITDSWGTTNKDERTLVSADYYLFFGAQTSGTTENGISLGIGGAALTTSNTVYSHWPLKLKEALRVTEGGTGVNSEEGLRKLIGKIMYPIGSIYMSVSPDNPSNIFGGTWIAWGAGRVPVGVGTGTDINSTTQTFAADSTGGEYSHTLTTQEMPAHYHVPGREADKSNGSNTHFSTNVTLGTDEVLRDTVGSGSKGGTVIKSTDGAGWLNDTRTTSTVGGSQTHNIIQPYITCYMWKKIADE